MQLDLSEEQEQLRDGLRALLDGSNSIRHVRAVAYDGDAQDPELWSLLAGAGWTGLTVAESAGGSGLGFEELMIVAAEAGRSLLHLPLVTSLLAARTIAQGPETALQRTVLGAIAAGSSSVTVALAGEPADCNGEPPRCSATSTAGGWQLSGRRHMVPFGPRATHVLIEASVGGSGQGFFLLPATAAGLRWTELNAMDRTVRQYDLDLDGVVAEPDASIFGSDDAAPKIAELLDEWRVLLAAESYGASMPMLERSVEYAKERVAFGRPIGSNQAVKVRVADMATQVERMRAAVYFAAMQVAAAEPERGVAVAMAKAAASAPAVFVGTQAIHVHGGIGYTWEHDMHLYFKRVKSNELLLGDTVASLRRIAEAVI